MLNYRTFLIQPVRNWLEPFEMCIHPMYTPITQCSLINFNVMHVSGMWRLSVAAPAISLYCHRIRHADHGVMYLPRRTLVRTVDHKTIIKSLYPWKCTAGASHTEIKCGCCSKIWSWSNVGCCRMKGSHCYQSMQSLQSTPNWQRTCHSDFVIHCLLNNIS